MSDFRRGLGQSLGMRQEMKINPRLYQAMDLLYMPLMDLQQHLKQELLANPFLEFSEPVEDPDEEKPEEEKPEDDEMDWEEILLNGFDVGGRRSQYEDRETFMPTPAAPPDLWEHLRDQLHLLTLEPRLQYLGEELIGNIDREGFLTCSLEEVAESLNDHLAKTEPELWADMEPYTLEEAEKVLLVLQSFYPSGVGARDLRETLLIQLRERGDTDGLSYRLVSEHFEQLVSHRWSELSKEHGISAKDVQDAADEIAKLDPKPGLKYSVTSDNYITPDLIVQKVDGEYYVFHNDSSLPRLKLSRSYREVARDKNQYHGDNKAFIAKKLNSAQWMIQAIEQRRQTMLRVMNFIVDRQREYFEKGVEHLRPLTLREVAEHIDMHESTVSRVTNDKYAQTPRGVLPLKFFFSSGLSTDYGEDVSARGIRARIEKLVSDESPQKPLTDQAIVDRLKAEGVQIARRTVAKYRDQLGILSARMRKRV
ncbi:MAG: RNA polymerase factor sigma-54 [Gemmatimonadota bacterium]|nr:RNA polymerase factor sigma-54 [Gemmatimonadota bacterium]MDH3427040.1 RNA polymerase factor sigma-54 [Gemmatimonadota bacterium]